MQCVSPLQALQALQLQSHPEVHVALRDCVPPPQVPHDALSLSLSPGEHSPSPVQVPQVPQLQVQLEVHVALRDWVPQSPQA